MQPTSSSLRQALAAAALVFTAGATMASDAAKGIEQMLGAAQQEKRGVTLYVAGQAIAGGVVRIEPGQFVEMRSQQFGRILVRLDRIDGLAHP